MQQNDQIVEPQERRLRSDSATWLTGREAKGSRFFGAANIGKMMVSPPLNTLKKLFIFETNLNLYHN